MSDIPDKAVRLAHAAYSHALYDRPDPTVLPDETLMRIVLEAAAPAMAEHAAGKITAHMENFGPRKPRGALEPVADIGRHYRAWRRHFGIAARIAARAFMTDDDMKREAAAALNRGDFIACHLDEAGNPVAEPREDGRQ